ncbi:M12 family metallo-peptidase [Rhodothermus marinus]|uniref:M12 family metallo-peptidase n=1 Tax=Rhodothermus marinus TaxID=29549 RepID=UPI00396E244C
MPLFEEVAASLQALGPQAQQRQQVLQRLPMVQQLQVVRLPAQLWRYRSFELAVNAAGRLVPGRGKGLGMLTARRGELSVLSKEAVAWNGRIYMGADTSEAVGEVSLVVLRTGAVTGHVLLGDAEYWVRPLGGGLHALVTIDPSKYPKERPASPYHDGGGGPGEAGLNDAAESVQPEKAVEQETQAFVGSCAQEEAAAVGAMVQNRCSPEVVRVLVLYTPAAAQGRDIDGIIYAAINDANQAYYNSRINDQLPANRLKLELVHKQSFSFTVQNIPTDDVERLAGNAQARTLRDQYQADVVVLLIDDNEGSGGWSTTLGVAGAIPHGSSGETIVNVSEVNQKAYAIVKVSYASGGRYTLAHEIGHIQGAQHHPDDGVDPQGIPYARGHRFSAYSCTPDCRTRYYATIMAYPWSYSSPYTYTRIRYFSNPNVSYQGVATGRPDRNNARVLRETADVVADFRDPNELRASIAMSSTSAPQPGKYTFSAMTCGGRGTLSYAWHLSTDPFDPGPVVSTASSFTRYLTPGDYFVTLEVQSSAGQTAQAVYELTVYEETPQPQWASGEVLSLAEPSLDRVPAEPVLEVLYPNPARDRVVVRFGLPEASEVELVVYDVLGREVVRRRPGHVAAGWHREVLMTDEWPAGRYVVVLRVGDRTLSKTLMRIR